MRSIFDPILPTTEKSEQNREMEAKRPKDTRYQMSRKGRFLTVSEMAEIRRHQSQFGGDAEMHASYIDVTR